MVWLWPSLFCFFPLGIMVLDSSGVINIDILGNKTVNQDGHSGLGAAYSVPIILYVKRCVEIKEWKKKCIWIEEKKITWFQGNYLWETNKKQEKNKKQRKNKLKTALKASTCLFWQLLVPGDMLLWSTRSDSSSINCIKDCIQPDFDDHQKYQRYRCHWETEKLRTYIYRILVERFK